MPFLTVKSVFFAAMTLNEPQFCWKTHYIFHQRDKFPEDQAQKCTKNKMYKISPFASWIHSYFDNVMTKFMINNRTDAWKTDVNLLRVAKTLLSFWVFKSASHKKFLIHIGLKFLGTVNRVMPFQYLELILLSGMAERIVNWGGGLTSANLLGGSGDIRFMGF